MTESFRRSGEYETPQGHEPQSAYPQQQYASAPQTSSPVNPEWPPPPGYEPPTAQQPVYQEPAQIQAEQAPQAQQAPQVPQAPYGRQATHEQPVAAATATLLAEPPADHAAPAPRRKRAMGPFALLAAVAIVAAAIGGGTAYGIQELTNSGSAVTSSSTSTNVVPSSAKGTVSGVAAAVSPSIVEINATSNAGSSTGSGVIITSDGEIITNNHVITGASSIKVSTSDGKTYTAKVVGTDSKKDLALIKLENASGLKTATLGDSAGVQVGDEVVAIGSPEGLTGTVTSGIVSALNRDVTVATEESQSQGQQQQQGGGSGNWPFEFGGQEFNGDTGTSTTTYKALQTDASLNPGNSGGALIDMNGNIIGINSAMYSAASSSSDAGSAGLGFAIPINTVKTDLATLRSGSTS